MRDVTTPSKGARISLNRVNSSRRPTTACCASKFALATDSAAVRETEVKRSVSPRSSLDQPCATRREVRLLVASLRSALAWAWAMAA